MKEYKTRVIVTACAIAFATTSGIAAAQSPPEPGVSTENAPITFRDAADALNQVSEATRVVQQMERDRGMAQLLQQAQGVFIVPRYGRAALGVGVRGGEGVLLVKRNDRWSEPAFYDMGGMSVGLQAGVQGGDVAFVLMNQRAVNSFKQENNWSLNADAGLTIVAWSAKGIAAAGMGDVVAWSDTEGLFGDLAVSVTDINFDEEETASYYARQVSFNDIITGAVSNPHSTALKQALASAATPAAISGGAGAQGGAAGAGISIVEPVTLLVPIEVRDTALRNGCWVQLVSNSGARTAGTSGTSGTAGRGGGQSAELTLAGDLNLPRLQTTTGIDWSSRTDRIVVGPNAMVTVFSDPQYQGRSQTLKAGQRVDNLRQQQGFADSINSMRINCQG